MFVFGEGFKIERTLIEAARKAKGKAYAPYSGFSVGAAVMSEEGDVFSGCNVENAVFPAGICAERVALGQAVAAGHRRFQAVAIVADGKDVCVPCGVCRQALAEFGMETTIIMANERGDVERMSLEELLPHAFTARSLRS